MDSSGSLLVSSLKPFPGSKFVTITGAALTDASLTGGTLNAIKSISASVIEVSTTMSVEGNVDIGGNLNVQGSVVARAVMDSSDARFKKDVSVIKGALASVSSLQGVS